MHSGKLDLGPSFKKEENNRTKHYPLKCKQLHLESKFVFVFNVHTILLNHLIRRLFTRPFTCQHVRWSVKSLFMGCQVSVSVSLCPTSGQRRADTSGEVSNWVFNVLWTTQSSQDDTSWEDFLKNFFFKTLVNRYLTNWYSRVVLTRRVHAFLFRLWTLRPVSYTHLTLPTTAEV